MKKLLFLLLPLSASAQEAPTPPPLELRDIAPPVPVFPYPLWVVATAVAGLLLLLGLGIWLFIRWKNSRPAPLPPTAKEIAVAALEKLRAQLNEHTPYDFSILVSDILRSYITTQYGIRATRQTSPEFLASVSSSVHFSQSDKHLLAEFLDRVDMIKFARMEATYADSEHLLDQAIHFVKGGNA